MTHPNFAAAPFSAGSLFGYRAFRIMPNGGLVGPTFPETFRNEENVAGCMTGIGMTYMFFAANQTLDGDAAIVRDEHVGSMDCSCGYYAYYKGDNNYRTMPERVEAIIEGYGRCTYGDRGFRCSKARLVALVQPEINENKFEGFVLEEELLNGERKVSYRFEPRPMVLPEWWDKTLEKYKGVPIYDTLPQAIEAHPVSQPGQEQTNVQ